MASGTNFKIYDPIAELIASGGGGGGGLPSTGGTLTGDLTMQVPSKVVQCQPPTGPCDLTNKTYVDSLIGGGPFLPLTGGTMSGAISQPLAPVAANDVVNKTYADSLVSGGPFLPLAGGTMSGAISQPLAPVAANDVVNKTYADSLVSGGPFLPLAGGTMSGAISQPLAPVAANDVVNKTYADSLVSGGPFLPLAGGTMSGAISQPLAPVAANDVVNKTYADSLVSGGPFLPLAGGTLTGNVILTPPAKIQQNQAPVVGDDLVNKTYVDGAFQAKQPLAIANNVAIFGSGLDAGQTIDSSFSVDTNLLNPPSNTTLWPSSRTIGALQYGANVYKATAAIILAPAVPTRAFSTGNAIMGPANWPNIGSTFSLAGTGVASITNSLQYTTYFRIIFSANSLSESTNAYGTVKCQIQDEAGPTPISIIKFLNCLASPPVFSNEVYLTCLVGVASGATFNFSVLLTNLGGINVTVDHNAPDDTCILVIERVA